MFQGLYINLDSASDRRTAVEATLCAAGMAGAYRRVAAVDGTALNPLSPKPQAGGIGCYKSHLAALSRAEAFAGITHVIEDDVVLSPALRPFLQSGAAAVALANLDIVFLCLWVVPESAIIDAFATAFRRSQGQPSVFAIPGGRVNSADSYLVTQRSAAKVRALLHAKGPTRPVDIQMARLLADGKISAGVVVPFLTTIDTRTGLESSIQVLQKPDYLLQLTSRQLFYVERAVATALPDRHELPEHLRPVIDYFQALLATL